MKKRLLSIWTVKESCRQDGRRSTASGTILTRKESCRPDGLRLTASGTTSLRAVRFGNRENKLYLQFNDKLVLRRYSRRKKRGPQVRKGKAMLQINTNSLKITNCLFDLQRTIMPDADDAEWLSCVCL